LLPRMGMKSCKVFDRWQTSAPASASWPQAAWPYSCSAF
jgi:hypothetical protein